MKRGSTIFLRLAILFMALVVIALCIFALPSMYKGGTAEFPTASLSVLLIEIAMYVSVLPFFFGLFQALKLLNYIDRDAAFSERSARALNSIRICASAIGGIFILCVPLLFPIAQADDAPGLILFGAALACVPLVVAVFAAILRRLLLQALVLKTESDLTI